MASIIDDLKGLQSETQPDKKAELLKNVRNDIEADVGAFLKEATGYVLKAPDTKPATNLAVGTAGENSRQTWKNCVENQVVQPLQYLHPKTYQELLAIVNFAKANSLKVKAIGSGHSFSDIVQTTDLLIDTHELKGVIPLDASLIKPGVETSTLFHVECGITIHDLNSALEQKGLALLNMGGYDAQTIIGATSTATHGSGITLGPLSSSIVSIVLISDEGVTYRIEPSAGITDRAKYMHEYPTNVLVQDDDWFNAVTVGMGCLGVVYSVILRVAKLYYLSETRVISDWDAVRNDLAEGSVLDKYRHYEVLVNPYAIDGKHTCMVTMRDIADKPTKPIWDRPHRNFFSELISAIPDIEKGLLFLFDTFPEVAPYLINEAMKSLEDAGYVNVWYKILNIGTANDISAYSAEVGFPMTTFIDAVEDILAMAERMRESGKVYLTSPFSLRFVKKSDAFLAMQEGRDTCMIEMPTINGTFAGFNILRQYETLMYKHSGRPHWGQVNHLTGSHDFIRTMYPKYDRWMQVYKQLNKNGMFDNSFTDRCGFSSQTFGG